MCYGKEQLLKQAQLWVLVCMFMACLNMFNNDQPCLYTSPLGPRISFSSDFTDAQHPIKKHETTYREAPVSSDFEFSVKTLNMTTADEIFFKGVMLPTKPKMTLREELLVGDDDDDGFSVVYPRLQKSSCRWKQRLGLKRGERSETTLERVAEEKPQLHLGGAKLQD